MQGELIDIGTLAARNLALALNLPTSAEPAIKQAIADEIRAMSSHFSLAVADVQTQYEIDVAKLKYSYVKDNAWLVGTVAFVVCLLGVVIGHYLK